MEGSKIELENIRIGKKHMCWAVGLRLKWRYGLKCFKKKKWSFKYISNKYLIIKIIIFFNTKHFLVKISKWKPSPLYL